MANYGSKDLVVTLTDSGATARDITAYIRKINGVDIEALIEDSHTYGDTWGKHLYTGFAKAGAIVIEGIYDDGANTPYALWSRGATRAIVITWGGGHTTSVSVIMQKWQRTPELEKATKYTLTLQPTGTVTEA